MELYNYVHSSYTDPIQAAACLLTVLVNRIQKSGSGDNNFVKWKRDISVQLTKMTRPVKEDHLQSRSRIFRSDQCKQKWSIPFDVPTKMYRILGWMESTLRFPFDLFNTSWTPPWSPLAKKAGWVCPFQEVRLVTDTPTQKTARLALKRIFRQNLQGRMGYSNSHGLPTLTTSLATTMNFLAKGEGVEKLQFF